MQNYRTYEHLDADGSGMPCLGAPAEFVFTEMLREAALDVRPDNKQVTFELTADTDPELARKQRQREAETRTMLAYQERERRGAKQP
ncbi:hypothetical protein [Arthrobacter sp. SLBN-100]|uniref:hypothetical protein n=1 Tax=Arthrobacter sp. SLBN-100 TaxID=2768450 RepID=UPI001151E8E1|nr:hypothetical protein [Arthrobacter sp. SLBN-100]